MVGSKNAIELQPVSRWGRFPLYQAKVGTGSSTTIMVKRQREFFVGQRMQFAERSDVEGMCVACTPKWRDGSVWKIEDGRLFVNLV